MSKTISRTVDNGKQVPPTIKFRHVHDYGTAERNDDELEFMFARRPSAGDIAPGINPASVMCDQISVCIDARRFKPGKPVLHRLTYTSLDKAQAIALRDKLLEHYPL